MLKSKIHAQVSLTLAILKANILIELLSGLISFFLLSKAVEAPNLSLKLLALLGFLVGLVMYYFAIKVRVDIYLFERWCDFDEDELDKEIIKLNANHIIGRTLEARLDASFNLFKKCILLLLLQIFMLMFFVLI